MMAAVKLLTGASTLHKEEVLVDFTIEVEDEQFKVHKVVMASVSDYFKAMIQGGMLESQTDKVRLHELSPLVVSNMIDFVYTGQFGTTDATTEDLLACAVYLQMPAAIEECTKLLVHKLNNQNCFDILATFKIYPVEEGVEKVTQYIKYNIKDIMHMGIPAEISYSGVLNVFDFWQNSELQLFVAIKQWVDADEENRNHHVYDLMKKVRFALMTPDQQRTIKGMPIYNSEGNLKDLIDKAGEYLNIFDILASFKTDCDEIGVQKTTQYIKANISNLMEVSPLEISYTGFLCFMDFWPKSEWSLFQCVLDWIAVDKNRLQQRNDLLSHVRFALMTPKQLKAIKQKTVYKKSDGAWRELVIAAEAFHNLPTHLKVLDESGQNRVRQDPVPICFATDRKSNGEFYSLYDGKTWKNHEDQLIPTMYIAAHITVNNYLIVGDYHFHELEDGTPFQLWHIFDPRTETWSNIAPLIEDRDHFALVHHKKYLYALGGCTDRDKRGGRTLTDVIERYSFETNTWEILPTKLLLPLEEHGACAIGDSIYVAGGYPPSGRYFSKNVDCLDLSTNTWESCAAMPIGRSACSPVPKIQVVNLWGEEVIFLFDRVFAMHYYSPSVDQWSMWDCLSNMDSDIVHSYCPYVNVHDNTFFLHCFKYAMKKKSTDKSYRGFASSPNSGELFGSVKWTVGEKGEKISEVKLADFPIDIQKWEKWSSFCTTFLSLPPQDSTTQKKTSAKSKK